MNNWLVGIAPFTSYPTNCEVLVANFSNLLSGVGVKTDTSPAVSVNVDDRETVV
jgi:hypothetical protein